MGLRRKPLRERAIVSLERKKPDFNFVQIMDEIIAFNDIVTMFDRTGFDRKVENEQRFKKSAPKFKLTVKNLDSAI